MVSALAFYSDDPSLNPAGNLNFQYVKTKINEKEAGVGPFITKKLNKCSAFLQVLNDTIGIPCKITAPDA